jgi:hypothetical protein
MKSSAFMALLLFFLLSLSTKAQEDYVSSDSSQTEISAKQCRRFAVKTAKRMDKLTARIKKTNDLYLAKFQKAEDALMAKMCTINEQKANALIQDAWYSFNRFENISKRGIAQKPQVPLFELNQIQSVQGYLAQSQNKCNCNNLSSVSEARNRLDKELKRTETIQQYVSERTAFLTKALQGENALISPLLAVEKTIYYYTRQVQEFKNLFCDKSAIEQKVLGLLSKSAGFEAFNNAALQSALGAAGNNAAIKEPKLTIEQLLANAPRESKDFLTQVISDQNSKVPQDLGAAIKEKDALLDEAQSGAEQIKGNIEKADSLSTKIDAEKSKIKEAKAWKPNPLKTKRLMDRISFGSNLQVDKRSYLLPLSGTWGGTAAFQLTQKSKIGLGASYIVGLGYPILLKGETDFDKFKIHHNGFGLRSFVDFKIWSFIYIQGGYEATLREFKLKEVDNKTLWSRSALIGLKIKYPTGSFKKRLTLEVLYDFLHQNGQPALVIRTGIEFNRKHALRK